MLLLMQRKALPLLRQLAAPQPHGNRVVRKLDEVSKILTRSAELAVATGKISAVAIQLTSFAATLWQAAQSC